MDKSKSLTSEVLARGLSVIRPLKGSCDPSHGWNFGPVPMPSYWAYGRLRALYALMECERIRPKPARILEVAAGDAALAAALRERNGWDVVANDLRENHLRESLRQYSNGDEIKVLAGNVFEISPASVEPFDLVVACEVIEHVAHGVEFLNRLRSFLSPGGRILLTTPNGRHFRNKLPGYYEIEDHSALEAQQFKPDADGHLFLIHPAELRRMAAEANLEVNAIRMWGSPFVTGHGMLRYLQGTLPQRLCLALESCIADRSERLCFALSAILQRLD